MILTSTIYDDKCNDNAGKDTKTNYVVLFINFASLKSYTSEVEAENNYHKDF